MNSYLSEVIIDLKILWQDAASFYSSPLRWKRNQWGVAIAVLILIACAFLDDHWLSDVLFSTVIGTAAGGWLITNHRYNQLRIAGDDK